MQPGVDDEVRLEALQRRHEGPEGVGAAQPRLPGERDAVIGGGDAVAEELPVRLQERDVVGKVHARPRHQLPLERVAMNIDDAGQHEGPACVHAVPRGGGGGAHMGDPAVVDRDRGLDQAVRRQNAAVFDNQVHVVSPIGRRPPPIGLRAARPHRRSRG